jgi:hypothetical protein
MTQPLSRTKRPSPLPSAYGVTFFTSPIFEARRSNARSTSSPNRSPSACRRPGYFSAVRLRLNLTELAFYFRKLIWVVISQNASARFTFQNGAPASYAVMLGPWLGHVACAHRGMPLSRDYLAQILIFCIGK